MEIICKEYEDDIFMYHRTIKGETLEDCFLQIKLINYEMKYNRFTNDYLLINDKKLRAKYNKWLENHITHPHACSNLDYIE